jgi:hypothetical protein
MTDRIAALEERAAIADIVHDYARCVRAGDAAGAAALFALDGLFEIREAFLGTAAPGRTRTRLTGRDAIRDYVGRSTTGETRVCPMIHNLIIKVDGNVATATCVMQALVCPGGQTMIGEYQDTFHYDDGWRFALRVYTILGQFGP